MNIISSKMIGVQTRVVLNSCTLLNRVVMEISESFHINLNVDWCVPHLSPTYIIVLLLFMLDFICSALPA